MSAKRTGDRHGADWRSSNCWPLHHSERARAAEGLHAIQSDDQLANRFEPVGLPPWRDNEEYRQLLSTLEAVLPLRSPSQLATPALAEKIFSAAEGILGGGVSIVQRAAVRAVTSGTEAISAKLIDEIGCRLSEGMDPGFLKIMAPEPRGG